MTTAEIEEIIMLVCVTGLVGYMGFIVVDLAKRSSRQVRNVYPPGRFDAGACCFYSKGIGGAPHRSIDERM